jgi:hypothetical protein
MMSYACTFGMCALGVVNFESFFLHVIRGMGGLDRCTCSKSAAHHT